MTSKRKVRLTLSSSNEPWVLRNEQAGIDGGSSRIGFLSNIDVEFPRFRPLVFSLPAPLEHLRARGPARQLMHRALQIPELVELTFSQFVFSPVSCKYDDRCALARAARTTRAWTEPALARLWCEMHTLVPLFRLLGPLKVTKTLHDDDDEPFLYLQELEFWTPAIKPKAWIRFNYYARYIRTVGLILELEHAYSARLYDAIAVHHPKTSGLLPNLKSLRFVHDTDTKAGLDPLITLLTPSIRTLSLGVEVEYLPEILMQHLPARTPLLESLNFYAEEDPAAWIENLSSLKDLHLEPPCLTQNLWDILGRLAPLENLKMMKFFTEMFDEIPAFPPGSFNNLHSLDLGATTSAWINLMESGNVPPLLRNIHFNVSREEEPATATELSRLTKAVATAIPTLEAFHLSTSWNLEDHHAMTLNDIQRLLRCENLHTFIHESPAGVSFSSDDIKAMLQAWPHLRRLRIIHHPSSVYSASTRRTVTPESPKRSFSLDILSLIAELTPDLEELAIVTNDSPPTLPLPGIAYPTLRRLRILDIYQTSIQDPEVNALYLARLIPLGVSVQWSGKTFGEMRRPYQGKWAVALGKWEEVEELSNIHRLRSRKRVAPGWSMVKRAGKRGTGAA